ncbi:MAG: indole-3-glycerol phosphate synthase TrpC [Sphingomonadales bacterium]
MGTVLDDICLRTAEDLEKKKTLMPLGGLINRVRARGAPRGFYKTLQACRDTERYGLIAEIKRMSPSRGLIRKVFNPAELAESYQKGGAACLSVLTDAPYFGGSEDTLIAAREASTLPTLRKDFILDPYQVIESRAMGADCILLIMAALNPHLAAELEATALEFDLDVLIEVHNEAELEAALKMKSPLIGINNRDLRTLKVDLATSHRLAPLVPKNRLVVAESGIYEHNHLKICRELAGVTTFLVGEALMRQTDVEKAVNNLLKGGFSFLG